MTARTHGRSSARSHAHLERAFEFLRLEPLRATVDAVAAIQSAVDHPASHPLLGRRLGSGVRELALLYGKAGYIAMYRSAVARDEARIPALRQQRELGFVP